MTKATWIVAIFLSVFLYFLMDITTGEGKSDKSAIASWYGPGLYGNHMACGGILTPSTEGVANKTLPCGTKITVCLKRCVSATVVDRGPFVPGRDFDLTSQTANEVGLKGVQMIRWYR